jgi:hypothetical protein
MKQYWCSSSMILAAVRYCLGRTSYIVCECADQIVELWPSLDGDTRRLIERDIETEFRRDDTSRAERLLHPPLHHPLGMDMDRREWERVRALWKPAGTPTVPPQN